MDDTWAARDNATGALIGAPEKFPSGIPSLVEHVHGLKLAFGIYTDVGHQTCCNRPGSWGHETLDAETFAKWEVDLVKSDSCYTSVDPHAGRPADGASCYARYKIFAEALHEGDGPADRALDQRAVRGEARHDERHVLAPRRRRHLEPAPLRGRRQRQLGQHAEDFGRSRGGGPVLQARILCRHGREPAALS